MKDRLLLFQEVDVRAVHVRLLLFQELDVRTVHFRLLLSQEVDVRAVPVRTVESDRVLNNYLRFFSFFHIQTDIYFEKNIFADFQWSRTWTFIDMSRTSSVKQYLVEEFGEQIIEYGGFQEWPPRSPDLTPMNFFLWGYLKQKVMRPPPTLQDLERRIMDACVNATPTMLHHVQREVQASVQMCIVAYGEKFEHRK
ncbi:hypothetical protein AVEN_72988-1 [Araneus ventricosus]|uniref:Tc1-like transposase DDE domain-containing protein n=1 Tax=Araneus ventricosus TaxID=182803 RepID=A0A4Y2HEL9_ARAVE|nr:hypothetical protein AVEN_72988-1 [Araneus ventricosus]